MFNPEIIPTKIINNLKFSNKTFGWILSVLLKDTRLQYEEIQGQVLITQKRKQTRYHRLSGIIEDALTGEGLFSTNIYDEKLAVGSVSSQNGFYSIRLPAGHRKIVFSYLGYESQVVELDLNRSQNFNVKLVPSLVLDEIIIHDSDSIDNGLIGQSVVHINQADLRNHVSLGGESDITRLIQTQAGVQTSADGVGGLAIRGGSDDQNLLLLDGGAIYYPNHVFGVYSTVNSTAIRKTQFSKTNFLRSDSKRLSSVIDVQTRNGNLHRYRGRISANLSAISAALDGPIVKGKSSFVLSGRKSLHTPIRILPNADGIRKDAITSISFYDYTLKWLTKFNDRNSITVTGFRADDAYTYDLDFIESRSPFSIYRDRRSYQWDNTLVGVKWTSQWSNDLFFNASINWSSFKYDAESAIYQADPEQSTSSGQYLSLRSKIDDYRMNGDWDYYLNDKHFIQAGLAYIHHDINPQVISILENDEQYIDPDFSLEDLSKQRNPVQSNGINQMDIYIQDHMTFGRQIRMNIGLFTSYIPLQDKNYFLLLPKIAIQYQRHPKLKWVNTAQKSAQYFHKVDLDQASYPGSIWSPINQRIKPKTSWLLSSGLEYRWSNHFSINVEGFYNILDDFYYIRNQGIIQNNTDFDATLDLTDHLNRLKGTSYGLETSYHFYSKYIQARANYTWSKTNRMDKDSGLSVRPILDRRHTANLVLTINPLPDILLNIAATYGSPSRAQYNYNSFDNLLENFDDSILEEYEHKHSEYLQANIRLDFNLNVHFKQNHINHSITLGVYNVMNRKNELYRFVDDKTLANVGERIYPVYSLGLRPTLGYSLSF